MREDERERARSREKERGAERGGEREREGGREVDALRNLLRRRDRVITVDYAISN